MGAVHRAKGATLIHQHARSSAQAQVSSAPSCAAIIDLILAMRQSTSAGSVVLQHIVHHYNGQQIRLCGHPKQGTERLQACSFMGSSWFLGSTSSPALPGSWPHRANLALRSFTAHVKGQRCSCNSCLRWRVQRLMLHWHCWQRWLMPAGCAGMLAESAEQIVLHCQAA